MLIFLGGSAVAAFAIGVVFLVSAVSDIQLIGAVAAFGAGAVLAGLTGVYHHVSRTDALVRELAGRFGSNTSGVPLDVDHKLDD